MCSRIFIQLHVLVHFLFHTNACVTCHFSLRPRSLSCRDAHTLLVPSACQLSSLSCRPGSLQLRQKPGVWSLSTGYGHLTIIQLWTSSPAEGFPSIWSLRVTSCVISTRNKPNRHRSAFPLLSLYLFIKVTAKLPCFNIVRDILFLWKILPLETSRFQIPLLFISSVQVIQIAPQGHKLNVWGKPLSFLMPKDDSVFRH